MEVTEPTYLQDSINISLSVIFIILNAFFVAAEFSLVKLSKAKIKTLKKEGRPFAGIALWLFERQNLALSACQVGITMASLALGWIGEPAIAHLIKPIFVSMGLTSEVVIHGFAFAVAFTLITALHIVIGEQVPKIYAIRRPDTVFLWSSLPLKVFYILLYPFMAVLNGASNMILKRVGIDAEGDHESTLSEEEIRASLSMAHSKGELSKSEHQLLTAVFRFDDQVTRQIMVPRNEITFLDLEKPFTKNLAIAKKTMHTRFPLCEGDLDHMIGVVHIKDLIGLGSDDKVDLKAVSRPPQYIPGTMPLATLMRQFQHTQQHMAFVMNEFGTLIGMVTMENVIEQIVGTVQDEFDLETPEIVKESANMYLANGGVGIETLNDYLKIELESDHSDTLSGLLIEKVGHTLEKGKVIALDESISAEILAVDGIRATQVRVKIINAASTQEGKQ